MPSMIAEMLAVLVLLALFLLPLVAGRLRDKLASLAAGSGAPQVGTQAGRAGSGHRPGRDLSALGRGRDLSSIKPFSPDPSYGAQSPNQAFIWLRRRYRKFDPDESLPQLP